MLTQVAKDYADFLKLDISDSFQTVQDVIDNMLMRLEELTSVVQMIKFKNSNCSLVVCDDINKYRSEITILSKKIITLNEIIATLQNNVDVVEKQVEKAEADFGVSNENKIATLLRPFFKRNKEISTVPNVVLPQETLKFTSVMIHFEDS